MKIYTTDRLDLRVLDETYSKDILEYNLKNKDFWKNWETKREDKYYTIDYQRSFIMKEKEKILNKQILRLYIFEKNCDKIVGSILVSNIIKGSFLSCYLGYKLDKDYIKKGYMYEALVETIKIIFNDYEIHRIEANILPNNISSINLIKKLGFKELCIEPSFLKINGEWRDHIHFVKLNSNV